VTLQIFKELEEKILKIHPPQKKKKKDNAENYPIELIGNTQ
jgi:hypothetical protein